MTHKPKATTRRSGPSPVTQSGSPAFVAPHHPGDPVPQASDQHTHCTRHMSAEHRAFIPADFTRMQPLLIPFQAWYMVRPVAGTWIRYSRDQITTEILNSRWYACWVQAGAPHFHFEKSEVQPQFTSTQALGVPVQEQYWVRQVDGTWIQYIQNQIDAEQSDGRWIGQWMRLDGPQCYFVQRVVTEIDNGGG